SRGSVASARTWANNLSCGLESRRPALNTAWYWADTRRRAVGGKSLGGTGGSLFTARQAAAGKPAATRQTARRARPLARRRARILRPSAVFMRARKPWSRLRLRLLGWYVRLVAMGHPGWFLGGKDRGL